jgi:hypothetical protein
LRQQIVIPLSVRVCPQIRVLSRFSDNADVAFPSRHVLDRIVAAEIIVNLMNCCFPRDTPLLRKITDMRDVLVRTLMLGFVNASHMMLVHSLPFGSFGAVNPALLCVSQDQPFLVWLILTFRPTLSAQKHY